jgi:DNA polymerase-3 subunit delta'
LRPLPDAVVARALATLLPDMDSEEREALTRLAGGSIGAALTLADGDGALLAQEADRLIERAREPDLVTLHALGDKISRMRDGLSLFGDFLAGTLTARIRNRAHAGSDMRRWAEVAAGVEELFARADGLNLEPRQTIWTTARALAATARRAGGV